MTYVSQYKNGLCLIEDECWYIGNVSERVAKKILMTHAKTPGSFLVLDCSGSDADYILLVNNGSLIFHHDVRVFPDNSCLVGSSSFKNLSSAVYHYTKHRINGVFLYDPTVEATEPDNEDSDIGPPPRVILEDEEEVTAAQIVKEDIVADNSKTNLDTSNVTRTHNLSEHDSIQKYPSTSPSGFDLGSLTCISGTKISPGFSSFETFKPKPAQNKKQGCDSPVHKPLERKSFPDTQKSLPASRLPQPKIYTTKTATQIKPPLIKRSAQFNLSSLTSIKKEDEVTKPKKVPPPVPPRRSSLLTISKTSLEEYADKLGTVESQTKIEKQPRHSGTKSQTKNEKPKYALKAPVTRLNHSTGKEYSLRGTYKISKANKEKSSIRRGHIVEKSTRPHILSNPSSNEPASNMQMLKHASYESTEKNGHIVMSSTNNELENVYKKITKFNWNSTEFGSNPSPLSSSSSRGSHNTDHLRVPDCISPHSSIVSITSTCSSDNDMKHAHNPITSSQAI